MKFQKITTKLILLVLIFISLWVNSCKTTVERYDILVRSDSSHILCKVQSYKQIITEKIWPCKKIPCSDSIISVPSERRVYYYDIQSKHSTSISSTYLSEQHFQNKELILEYQPDIGNRPGTRTIPLSIETKRELQIDTSCVYCINSPCEFKNGFFLELMGGASKNEENYGTMYSLDDISNPDYGVFYMGGKKIKQIYKERKFIGDLALGYRVSIFNFSVLYSYGQKMHFINTGIERDLKLLFLQLKLHIPFISNTILGICTKPYVLIELGMDFNKESIDLFKYNMKPKQNDCIDFLKNNFDMGTPISTGFGLGLTTQLSKHFYFDIEYNLRKIEYGNLMNYELYKNIPVRSNYSSTIFKIGINYTF